MLPDGDQRARVLLTTGVDPTHWLFTAPTITDLNTQICLLKKAVHGRKRMEKRWKMETTFLNREKARKERKYRLFISALVGKKKVPFDMSKICNLDGDMEADPEKVHDILTEWFAK